MVPTHAHTDPQLPRVVLDAPSWIPSEKIPRWTVIATIVAIFPITALITVVPYLLGWLDNGSLQGLGYLGIFLINFFATAAWFVPIPPVAGHAAIIAGSQTLFKPGVIVAGSAGMTLAESTAYLAGMMGRAAAQEHPLRMTGPLRRWFEAAARVIHRLMDHYGFLTLLVLSCIPNPVFEFAGISAGAIRMNFWRFLLAVGIGKTARVILLVVAGDATLQALHLT